MLLGDPHALMPKETRHALNWHAGEQEFDGKRIAEAMRMGIGYASQN